MKKLVLIVMALVLALSTSVAFAEGATGTITVDVQGTNFDMTFTLWDSFANVDPTATDYFWQGDASALPGDLKVATSSDGTGQSIFWTLAASTTEGPSYCYTAINPYFNGDPNTTGSWADFVNNRGAQGAINADTIGLVFSIATDSEVLFSIDGILWDEANGAACQIATNGDDVFLVQDGEVSVADIDNGVYRNTIVIPANFDGYVILPTSRLAYNDANTGIAQEGSWNSGNLAGKVYFWQIATYFQNNDGAASVIELKDIYTLNEPATPENTESTAPENTESTEPENTESTEPSDEPTEEISEQPSEETTNDAGDNGDDSTDTADLSVIAYAAAAITGLGALVVAKRK